MSKPVIAIKLSPKNYAGLVSLGNTVVAGLTGNLSFTSPTPTLISLGGAITDVEDAIGKWGPKGNRGSHANLVDLRSKALLLHDMLKALSQYVQTTAQVTAGTDYPAMATLITSSGFQLSNPRNPQGILQMVQNFHNFISRKLDPNQVKLKWKKPLNTTSAGNVKSYRVLRASTTNFADAVEIGATTKTSFIDTNTTATTQTYAYWVIPVNTMGDGVVSESVNVTVPAA